MTMLRLLPLMSFCLLAACRSLDPTVLEQETPPAPTYDAGTDAAAALKACNDCLAAPNDPGPGCADQYRACHADPQCDAQQECYAANCSWAIASADVFACGSQCFADLGVAPGDPASLLSYDIYLCSTGACKSVCFPTE
jgi:hypothetical protein